jgi:hypothetical protein
MVSWYSATRARSRVTNSSPASVINTSTLRLSAASAARCTQPRLTILSMSLVSAG